MAWEGGREEVSLSAPPSFYSSRRGHSLTDRKECNFPRPQPKQELSEGATSKLGRTTRAAERGPTTVVLQARCPSTERARSSHRPKRTDEGEAAVTCTYFVAPRRRRPTSTLHSLAYRVYSRACLNDGFSTFKMSRCQVRPCQQLSLIKD